MPPNQHCSICDAYAACEACDACLEVVCVECLRRSGPHVLCIECWTADGRESADSDVGNQDRNHISIQGNKRSTNHENL